MVHTKRSVTEAFIIKYIGELLPGKGITPNQKIYKDLFAGMSDKEFLTFMTGLRDGNIKLSIIAPNFSEDKLDIDRNFKIAEELGHEFFERIWMHDEDGSPAYLSPIPYLVIDLPLRRQAQLLVKKVSIPEDNKSIDDLTGQPTGKSKGSKISYPEVQILAALDLEECLNELMKYRGGDERGFAAMNDSISKTGSVTLVSISHLASGVVSTQTLKTLLTSMHVQNTLPQG